MVLEERLLILEEFKLAVQKGKVNLTEWSKRFGYVKPSGLIYFLKKYEVKYIAHHMYSFTPEEKAKICELYKDGNTLKEIGIIYGNAF